MTFENTHRLARGMAAALLLILAVPLCAAVPSGYLDVTAAPYNADKTGVADATAALQAAINAGRDNNLVVWLPGGTYKVSDRLLVDQPDDTDDFPVVLMGSTVNPANRATIVLAANSPGFNNPASRKVVLHYINKTLNGDPFNGFNETGNTDLYNQAVIGVDIKILSGNSGAVALRMQGAEGCAIEDVNIDLTEGGHTGIWGIPGSGGATHKVTVTGGAIGIDTRKIDSVSGGGSQPEPVVTGSTFINQTDKALYATTRGSLVLVGCRIERNLPGPAIWLNYHWVGQPFDASLQLVDCEINYATYSMQNTVIVMSGAGSGRSFYLDNTHVRNAHQVWTAGAPANPSGWIRYKRLAVHVQPSARSWGQPAEPVYVDGALYGDVLVQSEAGVAPPADLQIRHQWGADFPTWETPGAVNVKTLGAVGDGVADDWAVLQAAITNNEVVFFPKGTYAVSKTLDLRPDSKLIGVYTQNFTTIVAKSTLASRFAGTTEALGDKPIIRTADVAAADTILAFLQVKRLYPIAQHNPTPPGNYAIEWRCAGDSLVRHVQVQSNASNNIRPDLVAKNYYGYNIEFPDQPNYNPIDPNQPQKSFLPGHWAWPCAEPTVQVRGNGGGRWYTFWMHGRQALRETTPFVRIENTVEPLQIYHMHIQQQDSKNHAELIGARNVTIYGTKGEIKGSMVYFEDCDNVRLFGHSGLSSPDPDYNPPYLFQFIDCTNFQISGIGDTIREASSIWVGGIYDRWIHANLLTWWPILDRRAGQPDVVVPSARRPILYVRGDPGPGKLSEPPPPPRLVVTITSPASFSTIYVGESVTFSGSAIDQTDGDISASATWTSSIDGLIGSGAGFSTTTLSLGEHTITLSATNSASETYTDTCTVLVIPPIASYFTNALATGVLTTAGNWDTGLPNTPTIIGIIDIPGSFRVSSGGTGATIFGYRITQYQGNVTEGGNLNLRGAGEWTLFGGLLSTSLSGQLNVGDNTLANRHILNVDGGSVHSSGRFSVNAYSTLSLNAGTLSGSEWLVVSGTLNLTGGASTFTSASARLQTSTGGVIQLTGGTHSFDTLRLQDGGPLNIGGSAQLTVTNNWDISPGGTWAVNFTGPSTARLSVSGKDAAWYSARYTAGRLLYQGSNTRPFADVFQVSGSTLSLKSSAYDLWAAGYGLVEGDADPLFDADFDGVVNLLEYALGGVPNNPSSAPAPMLGLAGGFLELTFTRIADPALTYAVWASSDLTNWGVAPVWSSTGAANVAGPVTVSDPVSLAPGAPRFLRLAVGL